MLQNPPQDFRNTNGVWDRGEGVVEMESHEPMKCRTESSIATLIPRAVGLLFLS